MKTKIEIIEETAAFYNSGNRGLNEQGNCRYITKDGKYCAVGRCMIPEMRVQLIEDPTAVQDIDSLDTLLLKDYRGHDVSFWSHLQMLHDMRLLWDENGLTANGTAFKNKLIEKYRGE